MGTNFLRAWWEPGWKLCGRTFYFVLCSFGLAHIGRVGSVFMTLAVTVERFVATVYPLKKLRLKWWLIGASVAGTAAYNVPRFFEFRTGVDPETGAPFVEPTELRRSELYVQLYVVWLKFFLVELLPYITILVLNVVMIVRIRSSMKLQASSISLETYVTLWRC